MIYRIKQFYWALISILKEDNIMLLDKYLNEDEKKLFMKMKKSDRFHCFRVCTDAIKIINSDNDYVCVDEVKMAKCALLHDVGKIKVQLNIIEKSMAVIINKFTKGRFLKYNIYSKINDYYNHPILGVNLLKEIGVNDYDILYSVKYHNNINKINTNKVNIYLKILITCDNNN